MGGVLEPNLPRHPALAVAMSDSFQILETSGVEGGKGPVYSGFIMHLAAFFFFFFLISFVFIVWW